MRTTKTTTKTLAASQERPSPRGAACWYFSARDFLPQGIKVCDRAKYVISHTLLLFSSLSFFLSWSFPESLPLQAAYQPGKEAGTCSGRGASALCTWVGVRISLCTCWECLSLKPPLKGRVPQVVWPSAFVCACVCLASVRLTAVKVTWNLNNKEQCCEEQPCCGRWLVVGEVGVLRM